MTPETGLVLESWNDLDRVIEGVTPETAALNPSGQSAIAWTLAHVTEHLDRMINHAVLGKPRHAVLGNDTFRMGSEGKAVEWDAIRGAVAEVRGESRAFLEGVTGTDLDARYETGGAITGKLGPVTLRYILYRLAAHHYFHIGVICCQRDLRGEKAGDYPGMMRGCNV